MLNGRNFFDQPIKNDQITYDNVQKIETDQRDDFETGCLLDYLYFTEDNQLIEINLSKQQALDADAKAIHGTDSTENLELDYRVFHY